MLRILHLWICIYLYIYIYLPKKLSLYIYIYIHLANPSYICINQFSPETWRRLPRGGEPVNPWDFPMGICLVGGPVYPPQPEKWWTSSIGMRTATQYFWENKIDGNQTTNQMCFVQSQCSLEPIHGNMWFKPLWKIWVRQSGWLATQYFWENKIDGNQTTNQNPLTSSTAYHISTTFITGLPASRTKAARAEKPHHAVKGVLVFLFPASLTMGWWFQYEYPVNIC